MDGEQNNPLPSFYIKRIGVPHGFIEVREARYNRRVLIPVEEIKTVEEEKEGTFIIFERETHRRGWGGIGINVNEMYEDVLEQIIAATKN